MGGQWNYGYSFLEGVLNLTHLAILYLWPVGCLEKLEGFLGECGPVGARGAVCGALGRCGCGILLVGVGVGEVHAEEAGVEVGGHGEGREGRSWENECE